MKKISVKNIIAFRNKAEKNQRTFLNNLNKEKSINPDGGGDYWVRSMSALSAATKEKSTEPIKIKIADILASIKPDTIKQTKEMYKRNLDILHNYEEFAFDSWLPINAKFLNKNSKNAIIEIHDIPVQITPSQVYSFNNNDDKHVGAIWFLVKLDNFKKPEFGMFAEALFIYLIANFKNNYIIDPKNCLIVDVISREEVSYKMIIDNEIPALLSKTLKSIKEATKN